MSNECKIARNTVLIPTVLLITVLIFLSSCGGGKYVPCPAYGNIEQVNNNS